VDERERVTDDFIDNTLVGVKIKSEAGVAALGLNDLFQRVRE
jgi:hypothetical protein